jgi:hypothetical protein
MLKGTGGGRVIAVCTKGNESYNLVTYADGSWGVLSDGHAIFNCAPGESEDCFRLFAQLCGIAELLQPAIADALRETFASERRQGGGDNVV